MDDIRPLIKSGSNEAPGATPSRKARRSITTKEGRSYEMDEDGAQTSGSDGVPTLKRGWLEKRGEINTAWKNRYFVLTGENPVKDIAKTLRYFKNEEESRNWKNAGVIELDYSTTVSRGTGQDPDHPFYFEVVTPARTYNLCAPSAEELAEWLSALSGSDKADMVGEDTRAERSESVGEMGGNFASFISSGPLVEIHSGWMKKKGQGLLGGKMQKRYFVLYDNRELHYFEGSSMENIQRKGRIRMAEAVSIERLKPADKKDFSFIIKEKGRDWVLDPTTESSWKDWEAKLRPMLR
jgi:hypothetical protein